MSDLTPFTYRASLDRVIDGDTVDLHIDLGFRLTAHMRIRLTGVDTPERGHPDWDRATRLTEEWMAKTIWHRPDDTLHLIVVAGRESGSFDRGLGTSWDYTGACLNQLLRDEGWPS
jgi:micrococcal nuclease